MAWLSGWTYRRYHDIAAAAGAGTNYQKRVKVNYAAPENNAIELEDVSDWLSGAGEQNMRSLFYAAGLYWAFYSDGTNVVYKTSTYGSSWSSKTVVRTCEQGRMYAFGLYWDETYLHYIYAWQGNNDIYYRRGVPNANGTISWTSAEVVALLSRKQFTDGVGKYTLAGLQNVSAHADDSADFMWYSSRRTFTHNEGTQSSTIIASDNNYHEFEITWISGECKFYIDGTEKATHTTNVPNELLKAWIESYNASQSSDWVLLRKYVDPEPAHGVWGFEEEEPPVGATCPIISKDGIHSSIFGSQIITG